jgi:hypothetical protein
MKSSRFAVAALAAGIAIGAWVTVTRAQAQLPNLAAPMPLGARGEPIYGAFEGWGPLKDGTNAIEIGYYNNNVEQTLDIPIGPNNHMDPNGPDLLQPTHFEAGRQWGVFAVAVPKDFGNKKITWTIIANGKTTAVQYSLNKPYWVDFYKNAAKGNTPPVIKFAENGEEFTGPPTKVALNLTATVGQPLTLKLWAKDKPNTYDPEDSLPPELRSRGRGRGGAAPTGGAARGGADTPAAGTDAAARGAARGRGAAANLPNFDLTAAQSRGGGGRGNRGAAGAGPQPDVTVTWKVHRGATPVKFADEAIKLFNGGDTDKVMEAATTATFSAPGEYWLRAQVNDNSGDGGAGEQCCWTNALVKVIVK